VTIIQNIRNRSRLSENPEINKAGYPTPNIVIDIIMTYSFSRWQCIDAVMCRMFSVVLSTVHINAFDVKALRAFRVLRPLKLVSGVPSKTYHRIIENLYFTTQMVAMIIITIIIITTNTQTTYMYLN